MNPVTRCCEEPTRISRVRRVLQAPVGLALVVLLAMGVAACGSQADASCSEFVAMDAENQREVAEDVLKENDVETDGLAGTVAIGAARSALGAYCSQVDGSEKVKEAPDRVIEGLFGGLGSGS